jgi:hypothetical protein
MRQYSKSISLSNNGRGVSILDTSMGCSSGMNNTKGGCYSDCYSARSAKRYGYDFSQTVLRDFDNRYHIRSIISEINNIRLDFVRIGGSGDPSEDWEHTLYILSKIANVNKQIVIITRHWSILTDKQLERLKPLRVCINTSVSALDSIEERERSIEQYLRLKTYCKSVLRVISCSFNTDNPIGKYLASVQDDLFSNESTIDTVFRPSSNNHFVTSGIINVKKEVFNGSSQLASKANRKTYMGKCGNCIEMCGVNVTATHDHRRDLVKQPKLF